MKNVKRKNSRPLVYKIIWISSVLFALSVVIMNGYSFLLRKYREEKIIQQVSQNFAIIKSLFQTQDDYDVINTGHYVKEWTIIPDKETPPELYKDECTYSGKDSDSGNPILYCNHLLLGKNFTPDYAITDYRDLINIYGGDIFIILGKKACKSADGAERLCVFVRFSDLPKKSCVDIATHNWQDIGAYKKRINEDFEVYFHVRRENFAVDEDMNFWKEHISSDNAAEYCNRPNNWIDFIVRKY